MATRPLSSTVDAKPLPGNAAPPKTVFATLLKSSAKNAEQYRPATP